MALSGFTDTKGHHISEARWEKMSSEGQAQALTRNLQDDVREAFSGYQPALDNIAEKLQEVEVRSAGFSGFLKGVKTALQCFRHS